MRTCECGGTLYRHGKPQDGNGERYRCKDCRKCITVREGKRVDPIANPMLRDWRHEVSA